MTHPEELLASYVDGTASPEERAAVDSHASTCARCRAEIATASAARAELKRLPTVEAPPGLAPHPLEIPATPRPSGAPGWYRWGGAAAAAAVIVLLVVMVLPRSGSNPSTDSGANGRGATAATAPVSLEIRDRDFGGTALKRELQTAAAAETAPTAPDAVTPPEMNTITKVGTAQDAKDAQVCLATAFGKVPGTLVRLISARLDGKPAYIGIYRQEAGDGQPSPYLVARAASVDSCEILTVVLARLDA